MNFPNAFFQVESHTSIQSSTENIFYEHATHSYVGDSCLTSSYKAMFFDAMNTEAELFLYNCFLQSAHDRHRQ